MDAKIKRGPLSRDALRLFHRRAGELARPHGGACPLDGEGKVVAVGDYEGQARTAAVATVNGET
jgi:hypothetical protein